MPPADAGRPKKKLKRRPAPSGPSVVADRKGDAELKPAKRIERQKAKRATEAKDTKSDVDLTRRDYRNIAKVGPRQVKKPSSGRGLLAAAGTAGDVVHKVAEEAADHSRISTAILTAGLSEAPVVGKPIRKVSRNAIKDAISLPAEAVPALYYVGKDVVEGKPLEAGKKLVAPYVEAVKHPVKSFTEHPLNTSLLVTGPKSAAGRGAGKAARAVPGPTRKLASTKREPKRLPGTTLEQKREYSPDLITKGRQVAQEKVGAARARRLDKRAAAHERAGRDDRAAELRAKAVKRRGTVMSDNEVRRRVDERVDVNEALRRQDIAQARSGAEKAMPRKLKRHDNPVVNLVAQGIIKPTEGDLRAYRAEIAAKRGDLTRAKAGANKTLVRQIDKALKRGVDFDAVKQASRDYRKAAEPLDVELTQARIVDPAQAARRRLMPYAVRNMNAKWDGKSLVAHDGTKLTDAQIRTHMRERGVEEPSYLTQAPNRKGARNFFKSSDKPANAGGAKFTGKATREGTFDASPEALVENAANTQSLVSQQRGFKGTIDEFSARDSAGKPATFHSHKDAQNAANNAGFDKAGKPIPGAPKMRPVRINPFGGSKAQLEQLLNDADLPQPQRNAVVEALDDALAGKEGDGPWALIPEAAAERVREHLRVMGAGGGGKTFQAASQAFRRTVLATSLKWLFGNTFEATGRAAIERAGPRSLVTGVKVGRHLKQIDPEAWAELRARAVGGGHLSMAERTKVKRGAEQFEHTRVAPVANALGAFWRAPGPKQVSGVWNAWTHFVFESVNGRIESAAQTAILGKKIRDSDLMDGHLLKTGKKAVEQAAEGLRNTNEQVAFARQVDRAYGKYSKFDPGMRRAVVLYTPFAAWSLNAAKFVYSVMPKDHPVATSVVAAANEASEEWRKSYGLDLFMDKPAPGYLQGAIPTKNGLIRASRYTPAGAFGSPTETIESLVLPQVSGVLAALRGEDWKGKKLTVDGRPANELERVEAATLSFLESTVPLFAQTKRVAKKGILNEINPLTPVDGSKKGKLKKAAGISQREIDAIAREQQNAEPAISDRELEQLAREQRGR